MGVDTQVWVLVRYIGAHVDLFEENPVEDASLIYTVGDAESLRLLFL